MGPPNSGLTWSYLLLNITDTEVCHNSTCSVLQHWAACYSSCLHLKLRGMSLQENHNRLWLHHLCTSDRLRHLRQSNSRHIFVNIIFAQPGSLVRRVNCSNYFLCVWRGQLLVRHYYISQPTNTGTHWTEYDDNVIRKQLKSMKVLFS